MSTLKLVREILDKVYHWHRVPASVKAKAVVLYFRGMSLRDVQKYLSDEGYKVSTEAIREWFHSVGKVLRALYTCALWVYVDETKIKKRRKFYYLWLAVDEKGNPVYANLTAKRDSWTAQVVLSSTGAKVCTTDKGPWYVSDAEKLPIEWVHETFGKRNVVERWFFPIKHRLKRFYKRFPWNAKYETVWSWLASFITLYTLLEVKS